MDVNTLPIIYKTANQEGGIGKDNLLTIGDLH